MQKEADLHLYSNLDVSMVPFENVVVDNAYMKVEGINFKCC